MKNFETFKKAIEKIMNQMDHAAGIVVDDENLKEYLIEAGCWEEDYTNEVNIAELVLNIIMGSKSL